MNGNAQVTATLEGLPKIRRCRGFPMLGNLNWSGRDSKDSLDPCDVPLSEVLPGACKMQHLRKLKLPIAYIQFSWLKKLKLLEEIEAVCMDQKRSPPPEVLKRHSDSFAVFTFRTSTGTLGKVGRGAWCVLVVNSAESDVAKVLLDRVDDDSPPEVRVFEAIDRLNSSIPPIGG